MHEANRGCGNVHPQPGPVSQWVHPQYPQYPVSMGAAVFSLPVMPIGCCSENENLSLLSFVPLPTDYILQLLFSVLSPVPNPPRFYLDMQPRKLPISDWDKVQILPTTPIPMSDNDSNLGQILSFS